MTVYAHSLPEPDRSNWEPLAAHLADVARCCGDFAEPFGWRGLAEVAGRLHDIGKCSAEFQAYIGGSRLTGGDHSSAGAIEALKAGYTTQIAQLLAAVIAGHHAGLADGTDLEKRLAPSAKPPAYAGWQAHAGALPSAKALANTRPFQNVPGGFSGAFLTRMIFSCLVDADSLETERFYARAENRPVERGRFRPLSELRNRLRSHMADVASQAPSTPLNILRAEVLANAVACAEKPPSLFTFTVPTGGGKTLASLSFALDHAVRHGMRRVLYVIPFTAIIEQTAEVFRKALGTDEDILEHHASFDWEAAAQRMLKGRQRDDEGGDPTARLHRAAENWDVPIVVTTAVQFFESLFAANRSRCRKLHNIAGSVIVLDEAQTLPLPLLRPCMAALDELALNYGCTVVLCTATQPALREADGFKGGFKIGAEHELAPDPKDLYRRLKRVHVEWRREPIPDSVAVERFAEREQMLCIVNNRKHAAALFGAISNMPGAVHLTTLMCPRHRRIVLEELRCKLKRGKPVRLVSTSLIEAGVDIDFPEVWRAITGVDSVAQAAGRCNREGLLPMGHLVIFEPEEGKPPRSIMEFWQAARQVLRRHDDPLTLDAIHTFFSQLYWQKGQEAMDAAQLEKQTYPILARIAERKDTWKFPFDSIARAFRMIKDVMEPVVVPWRADDEDRAAENLLNKIATSPSPSRNDLRRLQQYTVSIPQQARAEWLAKGVLLPVHPALGEAILRFMDLSLYDPNTGVRLTEPTYRTAEDNMM